MSGIVWGNIKLNNINIEEKVGLLMMNPMYKYKIDKYSYICDKNIFMGCGLQYITDESLREILPLYQKEANLIITADAIIDNREDLLNKLDLKKSKVSDFSDSEYILMAYKKWGIECPKYLLGDFAFVIWDYDKNQLFCARDQVGKRSFYYYYNNEEIIFSTLIAPITEAINKKEINEKWIAEYLAIIGVLNSSNAEETMYTGIYQLPPASSMVVNDKTIHLYKYWNPEKNLSTLKLKTDKEYEELFIKTFKEAVKCRIRSNKEVGILLSSGLDSSSVAAVAATELKKDNKCLKSFTSVPLSENNTIKVSRRTVDETEGVKLLLQKYKNIDSEFCELRGENSINKIDEYTKTLEFPYKAIENIYWYMGLTEKAANKGCKVLLDGQFGNCSISYGEYYTNLLTLIKGMKFLKVSKEVRGLNKKYNISIKRCLKDSLDLITPYKIRKYKFLKNNKDFNKYNWTSINNNLLSKWNLDSVLENKNINMYPMAYHDWNTTKRNILNPSTVSHMGEYETKVGLRYGLIKRDPTRDKRVIELLLSYPSEQFVRFAEERFLIRRAMKGWLPEEILTDKLPRGLQSADWKERLYQDWSSTYAKLINMVNDDSIKYYLDIDILHSYLCKFKKIKNHYTNEDKYELRTLLSAYVFYNFIAMKA